MAQQHLQRAIGVGLGGARQRGAAEERHGAGVAGPAERASLDHGITQPPLAWMTCPVR